MPLSRRDRKKAMREERAQEIEIQSWSGQSGMFRKHSSVRLAKLMVSVTDEVGTTLSPGDPVVVLGELQIDDAENFQVVVNNIIRSPIQHHFGK
jgi:hypothetical protein